MIWEELGILRFDGTRRDDILATEQTNRYDLR